MSQPHQQRRKAERLELIHEQIADGSLIVRKASDEQIEQWRREREQRVYVPVFTGGTSAGQQTEGSGVSEATPTTGLEGGELKNIAGMCVVTEEFRQRGFGGGNVDELIGKQIQEQLDEKIDSYVIKVAIENGEGVTGATEYKTLKLLEDMSKAAEKLADTAGTRLRATHFSARPTFSGSSVAKGMPRRNGP